MKPKISILLASFILLLTACSVASPGSSGDYCYYCSGIVHDRDTTGKCPAAVELNVRIANINDRARWRRQMGVHRTLKDSQGDAPRCTLALYQRAYFWGVAK